MPTISSQQHAILKALLCQRPQSTTRLVTQFPGAATDLIELREHNLIVERNDAIWAITQSGALALLEAILQQQTAMPIWPKNLGWMREIALGKATEMAPTLTPTLTKLLEEPHARRLLPYLAPSWQRLFFDYWAINALLDGAEWPFNDEELPESLRDYARLWQQEHAWWFANATTLTPWPAFSSFWEQSGHDQQALLSLAPSKPPLGFAPIAWLGWLEWLLPMEASQWQRNWQKIPAHETVAFTLVRWQWEGYSSNNLIDMLQLPVEEILWGYLWVDLCAMQRQGEQSTLRAILQKWPTIAWLNQPPQHRMMALCQDGLRLLLEIPLESGPLQGLDLEEEDDSDNDSAAPQQWLSWLQGMGKKSQPPKSKERIAWMLLESGSIECRLQRIGSRGEWTSGRRIDPLLLSNQYASLLDDADWRLANLLKEEDLTEDQLWVELGNHPRLLNPNGDKLQLIFEPVLVDFDALNAHQWREAITPAALIDEPLAITPLAADLWQVVRFNKAQREWFERCQQADELPALCEGLHWFSLQQQTGNVTLSEWQGVPVLQLYWRKSQGLTLNWVSRHESGRELPLAQGDKWVRVEPRSNHYWQRDRQHEETQWLQGAARLEQSSPQLSWLLEEEDALTFIELLPRFVAAGIIIEWHEQSPRLRSVDAGALSLQIEQKQEWFQIDGELALDEHQVLDLRLLLRHFQPNERLVILDEESSIVLSERLTTQLTMLTSVGGSELQLSRRLAYPLQRLFTELSLHGDQAWQKLAEEWQTPIQCDETLLQNLRDYQREGVNWMVGLAHHGFGACLADDMGLGKTIQALTLLRHRAHLGAALVVVPKSVLTNWQEEAARFAPELEVIALDQGSTGVSRIRTAKAGQLFLINYGLLTSLSSPLSAVRWSSLVIDEAQQIKNAATRRARILTLLDGDFRLALSGTPVENHLGELWSLFAFINPGLLGSQRDFKRRFGRAAQNEQSMALLREVIHPFILRRLKRDVLTELPEKTEIVHHVTLSEEERALYEATRREVVQQIQTGESGGLMHVLSGLTKLRRLCCSPQLLLPEWANGGSKLEEAMNLVAEAIAGGHRILLFSQFVDLLTIVRKELEVRQLDYCYLDGSSSMQARQQAIKRFREEPVPLFLISLKAGGTGLNLTQADTVIHLDPWWNPAVEDQASDRAHRIGQTEPVTIYRLVCSNTVEEKIVALHQEKRALADSLLQGQSEATPLDIAALRSLLTEPS